MLASLRKWFIFIFILVSLLLGSWLCAENTAPVQLVLFGYLLEAQPLGLLVIATFSAGVIVGLLGNVLTISWLLFRLKRLQKRLTIMENQHPEKRK
jgi:uncharacterized integral membrane protein